MHTYAIMYMQYSSTYVTIPTSYAKAQWNWMVGWNTGMNFDPQVALKLHEDEDDT